MIKYPIGIQNFEKLRKQGLLYIDKTKYIYRLVKTGEYFFLSRPRRFGKSLLLSTLQAFFEGKRELFKGLFIDSCDDISWEPHPVIYIDLNASKYTEDNALRDRLNTQLEEYEKTYGRNESTRTLEGRFMHIIKAAHEKTGRQVVVLIDEYDKPILDTLHIEERELEHRDMLSGFYSVLKSADRYLKFCLLTGITKFSHLNIFSGLNNLNNISLDEQFEAICGVTQTELLDNFGEGIDALARKEGVTFEEAVRILKENYDGYHFSTNLEDIYNPFSLINALSKSVIGSYWFATGTPSSLLRRFVKLDIPVDRLNGIKANVLALEDGGGDNPITVLYQAGYLTIKSFDRRTRRYTLGFPNREVKESFFDCILPIYTDMNRGRSSNMLNDMTDALLDGEPDMFLKNLNALFAGFPYETALDTERHFHNVFYTVVTLLGYMVDTEHHTSDGSIDLLVRTDEYIYIFEFKINQSPAVALAQIEEKGYAAPFAADTRRLFRVGVGFSTAERRLSGWEIEERDRD